jgi:hypothetical protein
MGDRLTSLTQNREVLLSWSNFQFINPKVHVRAYQARRPVIDKGGCTHPEPWPQPGCRCCQLGCLYKGVSTAREEKNSSLPFVSEQYAARCTSQTFSLFLVPPPFETLAHDITPGEGANPIQGATDNPDLEPLKPPDLVIEDLGEAGVVPLAPSDAPGLPEHLERLGLVCAAVGMQEPGGALAAMSAGLSNDRINT